MMWWCEGVRELFMNGLLGEAEEERVTLVYSLSAKLRKKDGDTEGKKVDQVQFALKRTAIVVK